jgi:BTB/POZ domain.
MNTEQLKKLYESDKGDVKIKMKTKTKYVISYILTNISVVFKEMLIEEKNGKKHKRKFLDMTDKNEYVLDLVLRYIYYGYNPIDETKENEKLVQENICEIIALFDYFRIRETSLIEYMKKIDNINSKLILKRFEKFELHYNLFETIRIKYCDYIIENYKKSIKNSICYDDMGYGKHRWCCEHGNKSVSLLVLNNFHKQEGKYACIHYLAENKSNKIDEHTLKNRCCLHREKHIVRDDLGYKFINKLPETDKEYVLKNILLLKLCKFDDN